MKNETGRTKTKNKIKVRGKDKVPRKTGTVRRKPVEDGVRSGCYTVSVRADHRELLMREYGSLTNALRALVEIVQFENMGPTLFDELENKDGQ